MNLDAQAVLQFWFNELTPAQCLRKMPDGRRYHGTFWRAARPVLPQCECYTWRNTPQGRLAEIIVLDQFSRNMIRDNARAFAFNALALVSPRKPWQQVPTWR